MNASTGDIAWRVPLGITEQLPAGKQNTGRPVLAGPIVTAGGVLFIASTDDNRFRALDSKTGRQLWVTRLDRRGNANPITYQGNNGKQYVAIVATDTLKVYAHYREASIHRFEAPIARLIESVHASGQIHTQRVDL